jgi:LysR family glycine cleavage system transcriptional activator
MSKRTPPFNALHAFVVTARHLNLTRAADELCVTQGAVSRQIASLEAYLGFSLFQRHARGLILTLQGSQYLPEIRTAFDLLFSATQKACLENSVIRLKAPTCAMRWLVPQLMKLESEHPEIHVSLTTTTTHDVDFKTENFDAAIVFAEQPLLATQGYKLFDEVISPVIAPHLVEKRGMVENELDLSTFTFLHPTQDQRDWKLWLSSNASRTIAMRKNQHFDTMDLAISAAIQGFGVAMADSTLVEEDIRMKRLVRPFAESVKTGAAYYLQTPPQSSQLPQYLTFLTWFNSPLSHIDW